MIEVYPFHLAPTYLQQLSTNGGDEDWIIVADASVVDYADDIARRLEICDHQRYEYNGKTIFITCHA